jgi:hypothetical protein
MALIKVKRIASIETADEFRIPQFDLYSDQRERAGEANCYIRVPVASLSPDELRALSAGKVVELELEPGNFTQSPKLRDTPQKCWPNTWQWHA